MTNCRTIFHERPLWKTQEVNADTMHLLACAWGRAAMTRQQNVSNREAVKGRGNGKGERSSRVASNSVAKETWPVITSAD